MTGKDRIMKLANHRNFIRTTFTLLILLTSTSLLEAYPPDNAAVLYYKAFLMLKEPSQEVKEMMADMRHGKIKANDQVRQCLEENRYALEFVRLPPMYANVTGVTTYQEDLGCSCLNSRKCGRRPSC